MKGIGVLPTLITLGNATCGFLALGAAARGRFEQAAWLIIFATICDALDGKVARMANVVSDFGAQIDSLADAVSYGVAPGFLTWSILVSDGTPPKVRHFVTLACTLYFLCALLRLARYNVEAEHSDHAGITCFKGLPSPAAGGMIASFVLFSTSLAQEPHLVYYASLSKEVLPLLAVICGGLMVSQLDYQHIPNKLLQGRRPFHYLVMIVFMLGLLMLEPEKTLVIISAAYLSTGILSAAHHSRWDTQEQEEKKTV